MLAKSKVRTTDYIFFIKPQLFGKKQRFSFETALIGHCFFFKNTFHRDINSISDNTKAPNLSLTTVIRTHVMQLEKLRTQEQFPKTNKVFL